MTRSRASARKAGPTFERSIADYLAEQLADDRIDRRPKSGAKDRGDIGGVRTLSGDRVVIECKDVTRTDLAGWVTEAHTEAGNDSALLGVVVAKRVRKSHPGAQWVHMTVNDLIALLTGARPDSDL